jgi:Flp pilus assembly secretin CpaC
MFRCVQSAFMRLVSRFLPLGAAAILALASLAGAARADDATIVAVVDQARLVRIPPGTDTLVIGNPTIADVTLLKQNNLMILTPRSFGETNFIALDAQGNPVAQSIIRVVNGGDALVVQRGMARESYSCAPRCQPTERLGDDDTFLSKVSTQVQAHSSRLNKSVPPASPGSVSH